MVGIIEESWLVIGREESDEVEVAMENYTAVGLCRKRARLNLVTKNKGRRGGDSRMREAVLASLQIR
jgi:hypothetical protein